MGIGDGVGILFISAMTIIPAAIMIWIGAVMSREETRHTKGHCPRCGYCLTGNVSGTCPECGRRAAPAPQFHDRGRTVTSPASRS